MLKFGMFPLSRLLFLSLTLLGQLRSFQCNDDNDAAIRDLLTADEKSWADLQYQPFSRKNIEAYLQYRKEFYQDKPQLEIDPKRLAIFVQSLEDIEEHNARYDQGLETFRMGINKFSDWPYEDFDLLYNHEQSPRQPVWKSRRTNEVHLTAPEGGIPKTVDWRKRGFVTPVEDQKQCGSCWAFSAKGALEGQYRRATGSLVSLSAQNLVDCVGSTLHARDGCGGGWMEHAYQYVIQNGGIETSESYPYVGSQQECRYSSDNASVTVTGYHILPSGDEEQLAIAVATVGPVATFVRVSHPFMEYESGIYRLENCTGSNHGVLIVGYGTEPEKRANGTSVMRNYWLIKNSWSKQWGDNGYFKLAKDEDNMCGVASRSSYPVVSGIEYQTEGKQN